MTFFERPVSKKDTAPPTKGHAAGIYGWLVSFYKIIIIHALNLIQPDKEKDFRDGRLYRSPPERNRQSGVALREKIAC